MRKRHQGSAGGERSIRAHTDSYVKKQMNISDPGFEMLYMPASLAHNISEGGACLGVALKTKDENLRDLRWHLRPVRHH